MRNVCYEANVIVQEKECRSFSTTGREMRSLSCGARESSVYQGKWLLLTEKKEKIVIGKIGNRDTISPNSFCYFCNVLILPPEFH